MTNVAGRLAMSVACICIVAGCRKEKSAGGELRTSTAVNPAAADTDVTPDQVIAALEGAYGVHPGDRRNHTKGFCALGSFKGSAEGKVYSRSRLFSGDSIPVTARFSVAGGDPDVSDAIPGPRGLALEYQLQQGGRMHMTMINTPMFFAATPRTFLDKMIALRVDPKTGKPDPEAYKRFEETHPDNTGQANYLAAHNPPPNLANSSYFGIHAFKFVDDRNDTTLVRWRFAPEDGEKELSNEQLKTMPHDFLEAAMVERMRRGPVRWIMWFAVGQKGDSESDPTVMWPTQRKQINAGTLTLTSAMPNDGGPCARINYDPLVLTDGIVPSNDPVLLFRSPSYAVSFRQRIEGK